MEKILEKLAHYSITSGVVIIILLLVECAIDNFRLFANSMLILLLMIFTGGIIYESLKFIKKKVHNYRKRSNKI